MTILLLQESEESNRIFDTRIYYQIFEDDTVSINSNRRRSTPSRSDKSILPIDSFEEFNLHFAISFIWHSKKQCSLRRIYGINPTMMRINLRRWNRILAHRSESAGVKLHKLQDYPLQECKATPRHLMSVMIHYLFWHINLLEMQCYFL